MVIKNSTDPIQRDNSVTASVLEVLGAVSNKVQLEGFRAFSLALHEANKEYPWQMPLGCKRITLKARDSSHVILIGTKKGDVEGATAPGSYFTVWASSSWSETNMNVQGEVWLYFASSSAGCVVEIMIGI